MCEPLSKCRRLGHGLIIVDLSAARQAPGSDCCFAVTKESPPLGGGGASLVTSQAEVKCLGREWLAPDDYSRYLAINDELAELEAMKTTLGKLALAETQMSLASFAVRARNG